MSRRRRRPFPFSSPQGQTATEIAEPGLLPQCQKWALRAFIELGGHQSIVLSGHCSEPGLVEALGVPLNAEEDYCQADVLAALKAKHRIMLGQELALPQDSPLIVNVRWLAEQVGLTESEQSILSFCVLLRHSVCLHQAMEALGDLNNLRLFSAMSVVLDLTVEEVRKAFSKDSGLYRASLVRIDGQPSFSVANKIELIRGLSDRMMVLHDNPFDLFADNFVLAPSASLEVAPQI